MGLISAAVGAAGGVMADQWKEYFYCESLPANVLLTKGHKRQGKRSANKKGSDNIISEGSVMAVADGQCMIIVEQGKVVDLCAEPGEYRYDATTEPSLFAGDSLAANIGEVFANIGKRFGFGGEAPMDQRVYYVNTKELPGNKYGTATPVPFRVVDQAAGISIDVSIRCFGEYSIRVTNPILLYTNVCSNVKEDYTIDELAGQMKTELMTALQPALAKLSEQGLLYSQVPAHTAELGDLLNQELSSKWRDLRGIEIVSFGVSSITASPEDEKMIKEMQRAAGFQNASILNANMAAATMDAMKAAASNSGGAAMAFMGMNMAGQASGMSSQQMVQNAAQMQQQGMAAGAQPMQGQPAQAETVAPAAPATAAEAVRGWTCASCGTVNQGKFCMECGAKKPEGAPQYKCDKCGWMPADPTNPPKFCPECGDPFGDEDLVK